MNLSVTVNHKQLLDVLLNVGLIRPVFIWGAPGIGKSAIVQRQLFAKSLLDALRDAVDYAGGITAPSGERKQMGPIQRAQEWFLSNYPLLGGGGLQAGDGSAGGAAYGYLRGGHLHPYEGDLCQPRRSPERTGMAVRAGPRLHAALCHEQRLGSRDAELWNAACDYMINQ